MFYGLAPASRKVEGVTGGSLESSVEERGGNAAAGLRLLRGDASNPDPPLSIHCRSCRMRWWPGGAAVFCFCPRVA